MTDTWNPEQYHRFRNERSQPFFDLLALIERDAARPRVADLGCGTGELTAEAHAALGGARDHRSRHVAEDAGRGQPAQGRRAGVPAG